MILDRKPVFVKPDILYFRKAVKRTYDLILNPTSFETSGDMIFSGHTRFVVCGLCAFSSLVTKENASYMVPIFIVLLLLGVLAMVMFIQVELSFLAHP